MKIFVSTLEIIYVGEKDFIYNHKGKKYNIKKGDILVMSDDYYSKYLLNKPFFEKFTPNNKTQEVQEVQEVQEAQETQETQETQEDNALAKEQKEVQEAQEVQETQEDNALAKEQKEAQEAKRSTRSTRSSRSKEAQEVQNSSILEFAAQQE